MKKTHTHDIQITGLESKLATRDCTWAFAFPMTFHHQWLREEAIVERSANNRLWAVLGRQIAGLWRRIAERAGRPRLSLAHQAQDFIDLSWLLSLPASRTDGAAAATSGRGASCN